MSKNQFEKNLKKRISIEFYATVFFVVALTLGSLIADFEAFELLYDFTRAHEDWDLDEILLFLFYAGITAIVYSGRRIRDIKRLNRKVTDIAYYDNVTQLPNRSFAMEQLANMLRSSEKNHSQIAVAFVDLDNFKSINDTFGHSLGDDLLQQTAQQLSIPLTNPAFVARLGGDEFLVLMEFNDQQALNELNHLFENASKRPYTLGSQSVKATFSIGVAIYPKDATTASSLLKVADIAMYHTKFNGKGSVTYYDAEMGALSEQRRQLESGLATAIEEHELFIEYQPQKCLTTNTTIGYEALLRWCKDGVLIPPLEFIPIAESTGKIEQIGAWVLEQAIKEIQPILEKNQVLAINISPRQFHQNNLVMMIKDILERYDFAPQQLELEIIESSIIDDVFNADKKITELKAMNIGIAIDDFGTGYSSLARLNTLPVDRLKIDKSFTTQLDDVDIEGKMIRAIINIANSMNLTVITEGVETQTQLDKLKELGCDYIQGYYYSRPMRIGALEKSGKLEAES